MPYLIDGHNLIGKMPGISLDEMDDEQALIEVLREFCQSTEKRAEVYFDVSASGHGRAHVHGRVTARYVRSGETADQAIARHLKRLGSEAANWTVVSSDNQVQTAARRSRARVIGSDEFSRQLGSGRDSGVATDQNLSDDEVNDWLELFGGEGSS